MRRRRRAGYYRREYKGYVNQNYDHGGQPYVTNLDEDARSNRNFRTAVWTGGNLQATLMNIPIGGEIGVEIHPHTDQILSVAEGKGVSEMGESKFNLGYQRNIGAGSSVFVPAGIWHNIVNIGNRPLKLYSVYAPPEHIKGTVHRTKEEADEAQKHSY